MTQSTKSNTARRQVPRHCWSRSKGHEVETPLFWQVPEVGGLQCAGLAAEGGLGACNESRQCTAVKMNAIKCCVCGAQR